MSARALGWVAIALGAVGCQSAGDSVGEVPPASDIVLVEFDDRRPDGIAASPRRVTDRPGYDNQPSFLPGGRALLYTSIDDSGQADAWRYDLDTGRAARLTRTPESEYSPTWMPGGGGFSVVRVEADGRQRLWRFDADGTSPELLLEDVEPVGYHVWVDEETVALFVLGEDGGPASLERVRLSDGRRESIATGIGRCLSLVAGRRAVSYVLPGGEGTADSLWVHDLDEARSERWTALRPDCEDYAWSNDGSLVMPCGSRVYRWRGDDPRGWVVIADLGPHGFGGSSRIALDPSGLRAALVVSRPAEREAP